MSFWARVLSWLGLGPNPRAAAADAPDAHEGDSYHSGDDRDRGPSAESAPSELDAIGQTGDVASGEPIAEEPSGDVPAVYEPGTVRRQDLAEASTALARRETDLEEPAAALPKRRKFSHLDREETLTVILEGPEEELLWSIARRIESGRLDLPTLPSTSMSVIELANNPAVEFRELVQQISMDPVLSSELLRTANSVLFASEEPVDTLHAAVVRIGLRALRSMIFSVSMRGTILRSGVLSDYAEDVWRQSYSVAMIARDIAPVIGMEPEKAFLLGLLQDIGKISLLAMLSKEVKNPRDCTPTLVGHVFQTYHQEAGAAMARKWKLPAEFISVAGCHHAWEENEAHTRSAALANLAHHLDLVFSTEDPALAEGLDELPALRHLAPQEEARARIIALARDAYQSLASKAALES